jgi:hypothetical protein
MLNNFHDALTRNGTVNTPDLLVVGLQEADTHPAGWVAQRCGGAWAGPAMQPVAAVPPVGVAGPASTGPTIGGYTKWPKYCYQQIGIMRRPNPPSHWVCRNITENIRQGKGEKGAVTLVVDLEYVPPPPLPGVVPPPPAPQIAVRLLFLSTHLPAGAGMNNELTACANLLTDLSIKGGPVQFSWGAMQPTLLPVLCFMMGDLNFRLTPRVVANPPQLPGVNDNSDTWARSIIDDAWRLGLFNRYDGFQDSTVGRNPAWTFPQICDYHSQTFNANLVSFPTYKRNYKDGGVAAHGLSRVGAPIAPLWVVLMGLAPPPLAGPGASGPVAPPGQVTKVKTLYKIKDKKSKLPWKHPVGIEFNDARQAWDIGWLDRIGYKRMVGGAGNVVVQSHQCWDGYDVLLSDHSPVFLHVNATVT